MFCERWLREITPVITKRSDPEDAVAMRSRNEELGSLLPIFSALIACYDLELTVRTGKYITENPMPEKGVTHWREALERYLKEISVTRDLLESYQKAVGQRLSASQTNLRTRMEEAKHGV